MGYPWIHRLEQWDLECWPIVCVHWKTANRSKRIFCLWLWGIQVGSAQLTRKVLMRWLGLPNRRRPWG